MDFITMVEQAPYEVLGNVGELEIRRYPELAVVKVTGMGDNGAFSFLFDYISGANRRKASIEMTTPVLSETKGMKVPMTAPVINDEAGMAFVLPAGMTADNAPEPTDAMVKVIRVPPRTMAVLRFKGNANERKTEEMTEEMLDELAKANLRTKGRPILMRYDPPFKPGFLRRNEVAVEIEWA